ncbi:MAG: sugar phosphate isomerase/epimerase [Actinomycetota bacterium]|nr:sugar phosphate isomerase/epimerase [Actinomycetota bacterium]
MIADELVLYAGCLPATPFRELVEAASSAGFDAISLWPLMYQRALSREGLDTTTMRRLLDDHGMRIVDLDPCGVWLPEQPDDVDAPTMFRSRWQRQQFFEVAGALGVDCLVAVHLGDSEVPDDIAIGGFAGLCDDAAEHGLAVALEFMPFSGVPDLASAVRIVAGADRPNGGIVLDLCHFARSGGSDADLASLPQGVVRSIQLGDGPDEAPADLRDEAMFHRALPGQGDFRLAARLALLAAGDVRACIGPELFQRGFSERPAAVVAADLMAATRAVLEAAG